MGFYATRIARYSNERARDSNETESMVETIPAIDISASILEVIVRDIYFDIKRHCNYLLSFKSHVQTLAAEAKRLEAEQTKLEKKVYEATRDRLEITAEVKNWLEETTKILAEKTVIEKDIPHVQSCCSNIKLRYSLGRRAKQLAYEAMELLHNINKFDDAISLPPRPASTVPFPLESIITLQSRKQIEDMIVEALGRSDVNIVGIWGIAGNGKTFTANNVINRMVTEKLVDEAVKVVVSQGVDVLRIQQEIADILGLDLQKMKTPSARAHRLRSRLKSNGKKIIVLDDIWARLHFDDIGIPCGSDSRGCKILLTSRDKTLLYEMNVRPLNCFPIMEMLAKEDAWSLFRDKAGTCVDDTNLKPTAEQVLDECKGLPLAIVTIGKALKDQHEIGIWEDTLHQLKFAAEGVLKHVYQSLRLSYDYMNSEDAKSLFLLCSIFPEDFEISLEDLTLYAMGLNMFDRVDNSSGARNRVFAVVEKLKSRSLLLDGVDEKHVKMHDVVRDVARFIAREKNLIDEQLGLKGQSHGNCEWAFIQKSAEESNYEIGSDFQCLRLLIIQFDDHHGYMNINGFPSVGEMQELEVLSLKGISWELTDCRLKNLKTLELINCCLLKNLSFVGKLTELEILKCNYCSEVEELPIAIGNLERLKLLDLSHCNNLKRIRAEVISKLNKLEELKMLNSFRAWESTKIKNGEEVKHNACLKELESLKKLTCLEIEIADIELVTEDMSLSESIVKYQIQIGMHKFTNEDKGVPSYPSHNDCFTSWIHKFISVAEEIYLEGDWLSTDLRESSVSKHEKVVISECEKMEEVFLIEKGQVGKKSILAFSNLVKMKIQEMPNLTAFGNGIESIEFPSLMKLYLTSCPTFKWIDYQDGYNHDKDSLHYFCNEKVRFGNLKELTMEEYNVWSLWCQQIPPQFFRVLEKLTISKCHNIRIFCSISIAKNFIHLKKLSITKCDHMEYMIGVDKHTPHNSTRSGEISEEFSEKEGEMIQLFPKLESLILYRLQQFKTLSEGIETFEFHMLDSLAIDDCPKFKKIDQNQIDGCNNDPDSLHLFCGKQLPPYSSSSLRRLDIEDYNTVSNLWCQQIPPCFFQSLELLEIWHCHKLKSAFSYSIAKHLLNLKELTIFCCYQMELVVSDLENETREQNSILFPRLVCVALDELPALEMFCERECSLTLPSLESMTVDTRPIYRKSTNEEVVDWNNLLCQHIMSQREEEEEKKKSEEEEEKAEALDHSSTTQLDAPTNEELHKDELHVNAVPSLSTQEFGSHTAFEVQPMPVLEQAESSSTAAATTEKMTFEITCPIQLTKQQGAQHDV